MIRYGMPILAAIALLFAITSTRRLQPEMIAANPPIAPPAATFDARIGAVGIVEASSENVAVSLPVPGLVTEVAVQAGDAVRKGQVLFRLDDRDLRAELALRQSNVDVARARLARLEAGPRPEEIPPARARLSEAQAQLDDARVQLQIMDAVRDKRAIRREHLLKRQRAVETAEARVEQARAALALLEAGTWKPDIEIARADLAQAAQHVERVRADLNRMVVTAPIAGTILQCRIRAGEYAPAGVLPQPLILMGATGRLHVRADIDEKDARRFRPGAAAEGSARGDATARLSLEFVRTEP